MFKAWPAVIPLLILALSGADPATAAGVGGLARGFKSSPVIRYLNGKGPTLAPFAHVVFCLKLPTECEKGTGPVVAPLDQNQLRLLKQANAEVNRQIRPRNDSKTTGFGDEWSLSPQSGDCEDYAITKRHRLIAAGWPSRSLRLAVAKTPWGEGHAVLIVKTDEGDLVLDNRTDAIKPFQNSDLRFLKIQSNDNPKMWFDL